MVWWTALLPLIAGGAMWAGQTVRSSSATERPGDRLHRGVVGAVGAGALLATLGLAVWAARARPAVAVSWGAGLALHAEVDPIAGVLAVLAPAVGLPIVVYAAAHEDRRGLARLVGLLVVFVGAMELLVVAADLLTLLIAWELVGWTSWGLIGHAWWEADKPAAAAHAFTTTRFGDLGLFLAASAAFAGAGSLRYADLAELTGPLQHVMVAGIVLAAVSKSAQVPFAPWLFSAMAGPTPVSALLHAATMVGAGVYLLARLHGTLDLVAWFAPSVLTVGLVTAILGGVVASLQPHAKKLLAASTSAQHGLMLVAIGAGSASIGVAHLVTHAAFKAALFLVAGVAAAAVGSEQLGRMRLGSELRVVAWLSLAGTLALAAVPPLGGGWTKEKVVATAGQFDAWAAVLVMAAGALSAFYATRFQLLAYGPTSGKAPRELHRPGRPELLAVGALAVVTVGLGLLWVPGAKQVVAALTGGTTPSGKTWELAGSLALVAVGIYAADGLRRQQRLGTLGLGAGHLLTTADWLGIPVATRTAIVDPTLALCRALARFDDRVVDGGVRVVLVAPAVALSRALARFDDRVVDGGVRAAAAVGQALSRACAAAGELSIDGTVERLAAGIGFTGRDSRRLQTGLAHHYYVIVAVGLAVAATVAALGRV